MIETATVILANLSSQFDIAILATEQPTETYLIDLFGRIATNYSFEAESEDDA